MVIELWKAITENENVRQNLSKLRMEIKQSQAKEELRREIKGDEDRLTDLLGHEDAKTRKNTALLMGELGEDIYLEALYEAYDCLLYTSSSLLLNYLISYIYTYNRKAFCRFTRLNPIRI